MTQDNPAHDKKQQRAEQMELLKGMLKGAKQDPKGAAIFFRDVAKDEIRKRRAEAQTPEAKQKKAEQKELLKGMLKGAKEDPKGAAIFFRDIAKEEIRKRRQKSA